MPRLQTGSEALTKHTSNTYVCQQWLPGRISWGTIVCSKCTIQFQKAPKNSLHLTQTGPKLPALEMAILCTNSQTLRSFTNRKISSFIEIKHKIIELRI